MYQDPRAMDMLLDDESLAEYADSRVRGGGTALHLCCRLVPSMQAEAHVGMLLRKTNIDPTLFDDRGRTAMDIIKVRIRHAENLASRQCLIAALRAMQNVAEPFHATRQLREMVFAREIGERLTADMVQKIGLSARKATLIN